MQIHRIDAARPVDTGPLREAAAERRDRAWGRTLTYSPKVFLPVTNLCPNRCTYCAFRRSPGDAGEWTMSPDEVRRALDQGAEQGCIEALLCLGDRPDAYGSYRRLLRGWGFDDTVHYLVWISEQALERGLVAHTNAGVLSAEQMTRLRACNASLGLMLENVSERLCGPGMPHRAAPDKKPARRLATHRDAGALRIPFTSGLLIGIGETWDERVATVEAIGELHARYGHIQEVIVQNFQAHSGTVMADAPEPGGDDMARTVAMTRMTLPDSISVQAPPNLNPADLERIISAGINDFGGISPVTPDYINPDHPWPHVEALGELCAGLGYTLEPRLPVYPRYLADPAWVEPRVADACRAAERREARR